MQLKNDLNRLKGQRYASCFWSKLAVVTGLVVGWAGFANTASAQLSPGPDSVTINSNDWDATISIGGSFGDNEEDFSRSFGLESWSRGFLARNEQFFYPDHSFQQWFYIRSEAFGYGDREYDIAELSYDDQTFGDSNESITFTFGGNGGLGIDLTYKITGSSPTDRQQTSTVESTVRLTNSSAATADIALYSYTDLDLDFDSATNSVFLASPNTIRQTSVLGSTVDYRTTTGSTPDDYAIDLYPTIVNALQDDSPTDFTIFNKDPLSQVDATFGMLFNLSIAPGESIDVATVLDGTFQTIQLPNGETPNDDGSTTFVFDVADAPSESGRPIWYDPDSAIGYTYEVTEGDNAFAELYLPGGFLDGEYLLEILSVDHALAGEQITVFGDDGTLSYDFLSSDTDGDASGVTRFRISGIETGAGLDPTDIAAFPTGLVFTNQSALSFSQSSIVSVPEPAITTLAGLMLIVLGSRRRRESAYPFTELHRSCNRKRP